MKKLGIVLPGNIGDIIISLPIAKYYHDKGYEIHWPIYNIIIENFKNHITYVNFYPLNIQNFNPIEESFKILKEKKCEILDISFTSPGSWGNENSKRFLDQDELRFDEFRYKLANVPFDEKWNLSFDRILNREELLFNKLVKKEFCLIHLQGSDVRKDIKIANEKDHQIIEIKPETNSIFDWLKIIENAKALVMIDSCFANLIEQFNIKTKKFFIKRSQPKTTPTLRNDWILI
jgi:hypothetical protein